MTPITRWGQGASLTSLVSLKITKMFEHKHWLKKLQYSIYLLRVQLKLRISHKINIIVRPYIRISVTYMEQLLDQYTLLHSRHDSNAVCPHTDCPGSTGPHPLSKSLWLELGTDLGSFLERQCLKLWPIFKLLQSGYKTEGSQDWNKITFRSFSSRMFQRMHVSSAEVWCTDRHVQRWVDKWMDGWTDWWTDAWMGR